MKTTLNIADATMRALKQEAARRGTTMSELVEAALLAALEPAGTQGPGATRSGEGPAPALLRFRMGGVVVNVADRQALYDVIDA